MQYCTSGTPPISKMACLYPASASALASRIRQCLPMSAPCTSTTGLPSAGPNTSYVRLLSQATFFKKQSSQHRTAYTKAQGMGYFRRCATQVKIRTKPCTRTRYHDRPAIDTEAADCWSQRVCCWTSGRDTGWVAAMHKPENSNQRRFNIDQIDKAKNDRVPEGTSLYALLSSFPPRSVGAASRARYRLQQVLQCVRLHTSHLCLTPLVVSHRGHLAVDVDNPMPALRVHQPTVSSQRGYIC